MVDIEAKRAEGKGIGYEKWAALHNLKQMAASVNIYKEAGFASLEELEAAFAAANAGLETARIKLKGVENNLREKKELQQQLAAYIRTKPARDDLKAQKSEKARAAYRQQHESEFVIAEAAARYFKAHGISRLPAFKVLQPEIERLTREKNACYNDFRDKRERATELQTVRNNIEQILRGTPGQQKRREQEH